MRLSLIRLDTDFISSGWGIVSKYPLKSASITSVKPADQRFDLPYGVLRLLGTIRVLLGLQVRLEDRPQDENRCHLHHAIANTGNSQRACFARLALLGDICAWPR